MRDLTALHREYQAVKKELAAYQRRSQADLETERVKWKRELEGLLEKIQSSDARLRKQ